MTRETIIKVTVLSGFLLSMLSSLIALVTGGDIFYIVIERFFLVFIVSAVCVWTTLAIINSVIIGAARKSIAELSKNQDFQGSSYRNNSSQADSTEENDETDLKGQNLDLTSSSPTALELNGELEDEEPPEMKTFEPFKPRRIETDKENN
ncbi:MAG: hypothetical protein QME63_08325 [Actinomycetota bacterium]|nr:hypothetical protein [Actinomycetota bacterium]